MGAPLVEKRSSASLPRLPKTVTRNMSCVLSSRTATPLIGHGTRSNHHYCRSTNRSNRLASGADCSHCLNLLPIDLGALPGVHHRAIRSDLVHELRVPLEPRPPDK